MTRTAIFAVLAVLLFGCTLQGNQQQGGGGEDNGTGCICPAIYKPVCGSDGKTYGNECEAKCAKVTVAHEGQCEADRKCEDSDGGKDVMAKGTAVSGPVAGVDSCTPEGKVSEYYCDGGEAKSEDIACPEGYACLDGLCQKSQNVTKPDAGNSTQPPQNASLCSDGDGGKEFYVASSVTAGGKTYADTCTDLRLVKEYYCTDSAVASEIHQCDAGERCDTGRCMIAEKSCSETDGGDDIYNKGSLTAGSIVSEINRMDSCVDDDTVTEYFCSGNDYESEARDCPDGYMCANGECREADCDDSDGGKDTLVRGTVTKGTEDKTDSCVDSDTVREYSCSGKSIESDSINCPSGYSCDNGKCVP
ncbi:MAG TPA: Kazal-type serine protease inhibitor family protein [Candidatus Bilamarchaeum sp.]|nr:Kazal-type serine protease inhibitor family protein [Candidatus Bilamarchaeum sp.]